MDADIAKRKAAGAALEFVREGMNLGLGTGSTAEFFLHALAEQVRAGLHVAGVPTSEKTASLAASLGIPLVSLGDAPVLDLTIDGADEIDVHLRLIKGAGGALLREKIVAAASKQMIVIADASKVVSTLGAFPLPVEVVPFGCHVTATRIVDAAREQGCQGTLSLRTDAYGEPFLTDCGNFVYDAAFGLIPDPEGLAGVLPLIPGVVESGLFTDMADMALIGTETGVERRVRA